jgi:hypothetical protein
MDIWKLTSALAREADLLVISVLLQQDQAQGLFDINQESSWCRGSDFVYHQQPPASRTYHAITVYSSKLIHHSSQVVDVCDDPQHWSNISCDPFRETYGTIGPSAGVDMTSSIIVFSVGVDRWERCFRSTLSTKWNGGRNDTAVFGWRGDSRRGGLRSSHFMVEVDNIAG